jgi:hypothetical protein
MVLAATWATQRPHQAMDGEAYFRDWFPYYLVQRWAGDATWPPALWPLWRHRFLLAAALLLIVAIAVHADRLRRHKVW